jgi:tRNA(Ile)-lysidine synthase
VTAPDDGWIDPGAADPALIRRFAETLGELWPSEDRTGRLGLAVSGGPDSMAMLILAAQALPGEIAVMSINHGLRAEAKSEIALVRDACAQLDVPFEARKVELARGNLQARAREARYAALARWAGEERLGAIATAHHADDQAETLLMRLARGSGIAGLAGVRAWGHAPGTEVPLVRPLLAFRREEVRDIVRACGIVTADDPSNADPSFDRVRVRQHLEAHDWLDPHALAASARHLDEAWRALEWYAEVDFAEMAKREETPAGEPRYRYVCNVPRAVQVETVCRIVAALGGQVSRSEAGRAADRLWRGDNASLGGVLATCAYEKLEGSPLTVRVWHFAPEPPRQTH